MRRTIRINGARENNLKNVDVEIKRDALTVITGVSGSGKSSLAYDVLFSEGQRRLLDSLSAFSKRWIPQPRRAKVDSIEGLSPVIAIMQGRTAYNPRSTVGTKTDIFSYLRLLFCVMGEGACPYCGKSFPIKTVDQIVERVQTLPAGIPLEIRTIVTRIYGQEDETLFTRLRSRGYRHVVVKGESFDTADTIPFIDDDTLIEVIIDRLVVTKNLREQLEVTAQEAMRIGGGFLRFEVDDSALSSDQVKSFYEDFICPEHHIGLQALEPFYFSFNDPDSSCRTCRGLGKTFKADPRIIVKDPHKSLRKGALVDNYLVLSTKHPGRYTMLYSLAQHYGFSLEVPFNELPEAARQLLFFGTGGEKIKLIDPPDAERPLRHPGMMVTYEGMVNRIDRWYKQHREQGDAISKDYHVVRKVMAEVVCPDCGGTRYRKQRLWVRLGGETIHALATKPLDKLCQFLEALPIPPEKGTIGGPVVQELVSRLRMLEEIGAGYLSLDRNVNTLSGGETQRVQLTTQIGSGLMGMLYILDEPSIGLHPRDSHKIINTLMRLRDIGNTVVVIEHDVDTIRSADEIIEMGPGPGVSGGRVVAQGTLEEIKGSLTGQFLNGTRQIAVPPQRRSPDGRWLKVVGARQHNLKNMTLKIPLGVFISVTGVSGSGKSSLIHDVLYRALFSHLHDPRILPGDVDRVEHMDLVDSIINIDQSSIGRIVTSNPATYIGIFDHIRKLFADTPLARERDYSRATFSFNSPTGGGRCEECKGRGVIITPLQFMPDVETVCPLCRGDQYQQEVLEVLWQGKNITEVLKLTFEEAAGFFEGQKAILRKVNVINELGLGYLQLGQLVATLSGGEAQRIKLVKELAKLKRGHKLYILDEPTTGLHLADIQKLLDCLNKLVDAGHTVIVIEHNMDVIKTADWVIDLGPEGGDEGGFLVAAGTPEEVASVEASYTGQFLKNYLR